MGTSCSRSDEDNIVEPMVASPGSEEDGSQGYYSGSRRPSLQRSVGSPRDKYMNESSEDRQLRHRLCTVCLTGRVKPVEDLVQEFGEVVLDLRSTSLMDDHVVEPLQGNLARYRTPRNAHMTTSPSSATSAPITFDYGASTSAALPPAGQHVLERSMGVGAFAPQRQRVPLSHQRSPNTQPPPLPSFSANAQPSSSDNKAQQSCSASGGLHSTMHSTRDDVDPRAVPAIASAGSGAAGSSSIIGKSGVEIQFSPLRVPGADTNEISMALPRDLESAAAAAHSQNDEKVDSVIALVAQGTPLMWAASVGSRELTSFLLLRDQDINEVAHRTTALIVAIRNAQPVEFIRFLIARGAKAHIGRGQLDRQALHFAVEVGDATVVRLLLEEKTVVNWLSKDGYTPLHLAVRKGFTDLVNQLVTRGADPSIRETLTGLDCFDTSQALGYIDIITFLKHSKRLHPTQFGVASIHKPNSGVINGTLESDMSKSAKAQSSVRPQAIKTYMESSTSFSSAVDRVLKDQTTRLNPALSRNTALLGVPSNPPVQGLHLERNKPRQVNPNNISRALAASSNNPPPHSDAPPVSSQSSGLTVTPAGLLALFTEDRFEYADEVPPAEKEAPVAAASATTEAVDEKKSKEQTPPDRSAKALFHQHGWSERTFHTNMSRKPPQRVLVEPEEDRK